MTTTLSQSATASPATCPYHQEAALVRTTKWPSVTRAARAHEDRVYYCVGDSGACAWVASELLGDLNDPDAARLEPLALLRLYRDRVNRAQEPAERNRIISSGGTDVTDSPHLADYVKRYGYLPWEQDQEAR
ncbi:MAG: hypothetical protein OXF79_22470 [Chloroflexi bacterium]|nr:hypothetical protein [Chloroflexota bacterium]